MKKKLLLCFTLLLSFLFMFGIPSNINVKALNTTDGIPYETYTLGASNRIVLTQTAYVPYGILNKDILKVIEERPIGNKEAIINFIDNIWDKKRITCKDVYDEQLGIDKKIWSAIWKDEAFLAEMKKKRVKIGYTKHSKKTMYLMKY